MKPLFDMILSHVPAPDTDLNAPLQLQISALDYSTYVGRIGVGRITRGRVKTGMPVMVMFGTEEEAAEHDRQPVKAKIGQVFGYKGLNKVEMDEGVAGDIVQITGIEDLVLGCTVTDLDQPEALGEEVDVALATAPVRNEQKLGRNELCYCGSGKKFKHCHGQIQ